MPQLHVKCPSALSYIWRWFIELHIARSGNGYGPNPIGNAEISAWCDMSRLRLTPFELMSLRMLDVEYLNNFSRNTQQ